MKYHGYSGKGSSNPFHPTATPGQKAKTYILEPHQGKEKAYVAALQAAGYRSHIGDRLRAVFALYNMDAGHRSVTLDRFHKRGIPVFIYPHAARPMVVWDGVHPVWPHAKCNFVTGPGHVEVMQRFDYPIPMEVTGWTYCEQRPFEPVKEPKKILFGPIHPSARGWIADIDRELNQKTFARLLEYCQESGAQLTVRHIKEINYSGLKKVPGVTYIQGVPNQTITEIDAADVVIGHQTFAYLSVARGKPTLMMGEDIPPRTIYHGTLSYVVNWEKYADLLMFPLDILQGETAEQIAKACKRNAKVTAWRNRFIGEPFDGAVFVQKLESYL